MHSVQLYTQIETLPMIKDNANPTLPLKMPRDVAVVRWLAGNHVADIKGIAAMNTGPASPLATCPPLINLSQTGAKHHQKNSIKYGFYHRELYTCTIYAVKICLSICLSIHFLS